MHWPNKEAQDRWEFVFKGLQAFAIVVDAFWVLVTYTITAAHQREAIERELRRPYDEKQLALYLDAARVHHTAREHGGVAARGARAAVGDFAIAGAYRRAALTRAAVSSGMTVAMYLHREEQCSSSRLRRCHR
jgi:hypothetical protein